MHFMLIWSKVLQSQYMIEITGGSDRKTKHIFIEQYFTNRSDGYHKTTTTTTNREREREREYTTFVHTHTYTHTHARTHTRARAHTQTEYTTHTNCINVISTSANAELWALQSKDSFGNSWTQPQPLFTTPGSFDRYRQQTYHSHFFFRHAWVECYRKVALN